MNLLAFRIWICLTVSVPALFQKMRRGEEALTTTEWALLVAGAAGLAIAVVAIVRNTTEDATDKISIKVNTSPTLS